MFGTYRTFLALLVVALHLGGVPNIGAYAVFGFYALSGYLMTFIMQNNYGYTTQGVARYAINRILRIYPIYWVSVLFTQGLIWSFGSAFTSSYHAAMYLPTSLIDIANNVFLFFPFREAPRLTPPAWALTVELFFYILIGLGLSKNKRLTIVWFAVSVLYHAAAIGYQWGWGSRYYSMAAASLPFATGALIYHYRQELLALLSRHKVTSLGVFPYCVAFLIIINWAAGLMLNQSTGLFFYSNYILCALMVVVLSDKKELPFISKKFDKWMGDFSYPIYLIHYQVGMLVVVLFSATGISVARPDLILMLASVPAIFALSWLITVLLERPIEAIRSGYKINKLKLYKVRYYYLATGMEGVADERDCGVFEAETPESAIEKAVMREYPEDKFYAPNDSYSSRQFYRGCLSAKEI